MTPRKDINEIIVESIVLHTSTKMIGTSIWLYVIMHNASEHLHSNKRVRHREVSIIELSR